MAGFCEVCGSPLGIEGCPSGHMTAALPKENDSTNLARKNGTASLARKIDSASLPKSKTVPRLLCSGAEFGTYFVAALFIAGMDVFSAGLAGLVCLPLAALIGLRDVNSGSFNLGKRISNMRVVDYRTGQSASNLQALGRNSYYCGLLLVASLPFIDVATSALFALFVVFDVIAIISNPKGRRLGDFIAGTQIIGARN